MSEPEIEQEAAEHAARLFDIRRIIGGLFGLYGAIITIVGIFDSDAEIAKAQGVNINLWTGIAMLVVAAVFFVWQWLRPLGAP
jgi:xanthine/uracil/vitamin C permease (AzgA family)